ncbi:MAG: class I SAM-dependent methyltransferase [Myxococcota bacterium]
MSFFDDEANVDQYLQMAEGYDGAALVEVLGRHLQPGASVLELGMGPGKDLALLSDAGFEPTGSDASEVFVRRYMDGGGAHPVLLLDAVTLDTDERFHAIYSNKVLQHLTRADFRASLSRQAELIPTGGVMLHSLWYGTADEEHGGLRFTQHDEASIRTSLPDSLELVAHERYTEMDADDSIWVVLQKRP